MTKENVLTAESPKEEASSRKHGAKFLRFRRGKSGSDHPASKKAKGRDDDSARNDADTAMPTDVSASPPLEPEPPHARTAILTSYDPLQQQKPESPEHFASPAQTLSVSLSEDGETQKPWFNFTLCGRRSDVYDQVMAPSSSSSSDDTFAGIPDDPTVQESIECVFAHQLEEGLPLVPDVESLDLKSPAALLQSRTPSRSMRKGTNRQKRPYHAGSLVHMGTYDPALGKILPPPPPAAAAATPTKPSCEDGSTVTPSLQPTCPCQRGVRTPLVPPQFWPQRPLMVRPTPGSGMRVLGIRFSSSKQYLWKNGDAQDCILWAKRLHQHWNLHPPEQRLPASCPECMILPINNGNEPRGESLVVDFESQMFLGTILVRVRGSEGSTAQPYDDSKGYFSGMNRRYQIVIRGKFLEQVPWTQCVAGIQLERPVVNLPPKWILSGALKVVSFFAPQLKASTEGERPYSVSPFGSTPQTLRVDDHAHYDESMEEMLHEPIHDHHTLLGKASTHHSSLHRARFRKRNFDKLFVAESSTPVTLLDKIYTLEFLQHLLNMQDWTIELGSMLGHIELKETLDGQPLQIMARHGDGDSRRIWSFDVWHESLVEDSKKYDPILEE